MVGKIRKRGVWQGGGTTKKYHCLLKKKEAQGLRV
jgi:hypothetical protein